MRSRKPEKPDHVKSDQDPRPWRPRSCFAYEDSDPGKPGPGQVLVKHGAIGLEFRRHLLPQRPLSGAQRPAADPGRRSGGQGGRGRRGCRLAETRRPRRLHDAARRLCRRARDRCRPAGQGAGQRHRRAGGGDDAAGHDRAISASPHLSGEGRRYDPLPCRPRAASG